MIFFCQKRKKKLSFNQKKKNNAGKITIDVSRLKVVSKNELEQKAVGESLTNLGDFIFQAFAVTCLYF